MKKMTFEELCNNITTEDLHSIVYDCYGYDMRLEHYHYEYFDEEFFNTFFANNPLEVARAIHFGDVNWFDEYIKFNVYGNLVSISDYALNKELDDNKEEIIEEAIDAYNMYGRIFNSEINELFEEFLAE